MHFIGKKICFFKSAFYIWPVKVNKEYFRTA